MSTMSITKSGSIELADDHTGMDLAMVQKALSPSDRRYVDNLSGQVGEMTAMDAALEKEELKIKRRIRDSKDARALAEIKRKRKLLKDERTSKVLRMNGVMEAKMEELMPGASLGEKIASMIHDTEPASKKLTQGRRPRT